MDPRLLEQDSKSILKLKMCIKNAPKPVEQVPKVLCQERWGKTVVPKTAGQEVPVFVTFAWALQLRALFQLSVSYDVALDYIPHISQSTELLLSVSMVV